MLNSGKKIHALRDKKINILTLVLSEKKIRNETKKHNPPLQVKWSVPYIYIMNNIHQILNFVVWYYPQNPGKPWITQINHEFSVENLE